MTRAIVLASVLLFVGCKKHKADETRADSAPANKHPDLSAPKRIVDEYEVKLKALDPAEAQDLDTLKHRTHTQISEWLSEETLPDGWAASYAEPKLENVEDNDGRVERKQTGLAYGVYVHRTIDGKPYKCVAKLPKREDVAAALAACKTAKP